MFYEGPAWNNQSEYPGLDSNEFRHDRVELEFLIEKIQKATSSLRPLMDRALGKVDEPLSFPERDGLILGLQAIADLEEQAKILAQNLKTYIECEMTIDAKNDRARKLDSEIEALAAKLDAGLKPSTLFLETASEDLFERYLQHPHTRPLEFTYRHARSMNDTLLNESEEVLLSNLRVHGLDAWGNLYNQISGNLTCVIEEAGKSAEQVGLAQAAGLLRDSSETKRRAAWHAIQNAWKTHENTCAAVLNGLAGWRLEVYEKRSHTRPLHFLDLPLHGARISRATLEAMLSAVRSEIQIPRRALSAIAYGLGKSQVDPWDLLSPPPASTGDSRRSYKEGLYLVREAFHAVDENFGDFVDTMEKNWWIEGRVLPNKSQGAYSTDFPKSRSPRVFQTYMGSLEDISTLAHELGHAYHSWVMRDLPFALHHYPMTLAETASIFAETALADHLMSHGDERSRFEVAWSNAQMAGAFLLNIPARFDFERSFYERRRNSGFVSAKELGDLTAEAWHKWYGDTLSKPDRQYWMSKLHFSLAGVSFYNFPYTFGYLFSLALYAIRKQKGPEFNQAYIALLRNTGNMTAEELAYRHLGEDITRPEFWKKSLAIVDEQVRHFDQLVRQRAGTKHRFTQSDATPV